MLDLLDSLKNIITKIFNNSNYINIISIIVVAFTTYKVTKYTTTKPNRITIMQSQLEYVYLPLFRLFENITLPIQKDHASKICNEMFQILDKHYMLVFPQLNKLYQQLSKDIDNNLKYNETLYSIKHQINVDYNLLKKSLGYPSENFGKIFYRMTLKQKIRYIYPWIDATWLLWAMIPVYIIIKIFKISRIWFILLILLSVILFIPIIQKIKKYINSDNIK